MTLVGAKVLEKRMEFAGHYVRRPGRPCSKSSQTFGITQFSIWLQTCRILSKENYLAMETALGLKPADNSNFRIQINFCCLMAKHYIWICRSKERHPTQNNFSFFLKHIHRMEIRHRQVIYGKGSHWLPSLDRVS